MTVQELRDALAAYPPDAEVFVFNEREETVWPVKQVSPSDDAPNDEVYLDVNLT